VPAEGPRLRPVKTRNHQGSLYIRWGYEIKSLEAWPMSGWNIDDVILTGVQE
jgi:hypothetical protein